MFDKLKNWNEKRKTETVTGKNSKEISFLHEELRANIDTILMCVDTLSKLASEVYANKKEMDQIGLDCVDNKKQIDKNSNDIITNGNKIKLTMIDDSKMLKSMEELREKMMSHHHRTALGPTTQPTVEELDEEHVPN